MIKDAVGKCRLLQSYNEVLTAAYGSAFNVGRLNK